MAGKVFSLPSAWQGIGREARGKNDIVDSGGCFGYVLIWVSGSSTQLSYVGGKLYPTLRQIPPTMRRCITYQDDSGDAEPRSVKSVKSPRSRLYLNGHNEAEVMFSVRKKVASAIVCSKGRAEKRGAGRNFLPC